MNYLMKTTGEKPPPPLHEKKLRVKPSAGKAVIMLCMASFLAGLLFSSRRSYLPSEAGAAAARSSANVQRLDGGELSPREILSDVSKTHQAIMSLDKSISSLEMELTAIRTKSPSSAANGGGMVVGSSKVLKKAFAVIGINTAFSSKKRRESLRQTWMPKGSKLERLEKEKGIVIRFVIGHGATPGSLLDRAIDEEDAKTKDFLRLDHVEGYHELSAKTKVYFATAVALWNAEFYVKVDDDVHVNLGMLTTTLAQYRLRSRIYIGCMKSGPVLSKKGVRYHEPEFWKFGEEGNNYFRHATGQIYAISKDLASYISINAPMLHKYANEDVSLGSWLIGLEVQHIDEQSMCCGTPDCESKAQGGNMCVASFDWNCSGICKSVERINQIHISCGEGDAAIWNLAPFY